MTNKQANKLKLFVVDGDETFNTSITSYLKSKGFEVIQCLTSDECITKISLLPDIIFMDYSLPGKNGLDLMRRLKPASPTTQFIFISAQPEIKIALDVLHEGAYDYILKDNHTKENALNKIDQIINNKVRLKEKEMRKRSAIFILVGLLLCWIGLFIYYQFLK